MVSDAVNARAPVDSADVDDAYIRRHQLVSSAHEREAAWVGDTAKS